MADSVKIKITGDSTDFQKEVSNIGKVAKAGLATLTASVGAVTAAMAYATSVGGEYETSLAKVNTIADTSSVSLSTLSEGIREISGRTGESAADLNEALYQAISASVDTANAVGFVEQATKLAQGGFTDAASAVDVMTTVINAYGISADKASEISDMLIQTQNKGKTTVGELASNMGRVIPTANAYGVQLDNLCSSYAIMTARGIATAETTTYMNSMLNELGKTGTDASDVLKKQTGKTFKQLMDSGKTLAEVLQILQNTANKSGKSMGDMFGSAEAGKAAMTIASVGVEGFSAQLNNMANSTGLTETAFEKMQNTTAKKLDKFKNNIKNAGITFYDKFKEPLAEGLSDASEAFDDLSTEIGKGQLGKYIEDLGKKAGELIKILAKGAKDALPKLISGMTKIIDNLPIITKLVGIGVGAWTLYKAAIGIQGSFAKLIANMTASAIAAGAETVQVNLATVAQYAWNTALSANPIGLVIAAIAGLTAVMTIYKEKAESNVSVSETWRTKNEEFRKSMDELQNSYKEKISSIEAAYAAEFNEIDITKRLYDELQKITDENGKIVEGMEGRAAFIADKLKESTGEEIEINGNVVKSYNEIKESIAKVIAQKEAQAYLDELQDKAAAARETQTEIEQNYVTACENTTIAKNDLAEINSKLASAEDEARAKLEELGIPLNENISLEQALSDAQRDTCGIIKRGNDENAIKVQRLGELKEKIVSIKSEYANQENAIKDLEASEKDAWENYLINLRDRENADKAYTFFAEENYAELKKLAESSSQDQIRIENSTDKELMKKLTESVENMKMARIKGYEAQSENEKKFWQKQIEEIQNYRQPYYEQLQQLGIFGTEGLIDGLDTGAIYAAGYDAGEILKSGIKDSLDINSPSKETEKIGGFAGKGFIRGNRKNTNEIEQVAQEQADAVTNAYSSVNYKSALMAAAKRASVNFSGILNSIFTPDMKTSPQKSTVQNTYNYTTVDRGRTVIDNILTLDGETIYRNQKEISENHGVNFSTGGSW